MSCVFLGYEPTSTYNVKRLKFSKLHYGSSVRPAKIFRYGTQAVCALVSNVTRIKNFPRRVNLAKVGDLGVQLCAPYPRIPVRNQVLIQCSESVTAPPRTS